MHFAPDTVSILEFTVALANTDPRASRSGDDELATTPDLVAMLDHWIYSGRRDLDDAELREVHETRDRIHLLWGAIAAGRTDAAVAEVNEILADARALPYLARHDGLPWHLHATDLQAPLPQRIAVETALAIVDVIRSGETSRMRVCEADECEGLFIDLSRNGSKRFCSVRCGNRMNQLAFRERQAD